MAEKRILAARKEGGGTTFRVVSDAQVLSGDGWEIHEYRSEEGARRAMVRRSRQFAVTLVAAERDEMIGFTEAC